jgi:hypothetical protein
MEGAMAGDPKVCRQHALECAEMAARAPNPEHKALLNGLARTWLSLAEELERAHTLLEAYPPDASDSASPKPTEKRKP